MKKGVFLIMFVLIALLSVNVVYAQTPADKSAWDTVMGVVNNSFFSAIFGPDFLTNPDNKILLKLIFMLLIFSILYGASNLALGKFAHNVRIIIALIMAIIATAALPTTLLATIAGMWGGAMVALMIAVPILGGVFLMFKTFGEPTKFNYAAKFGIALVMFWLVGAVTNTTNNFTSFTALGTALEGANTLPITVLSNMMPLLLVFFFIMSIWYFIRMFTAGTTVSEGEGVEGIASHWGELKKAKDKLFGSGSAGVYLVDHLISELNKARRARAANNDGDLIAALENAKGLVGDMKGAISDIHEGGQVDSGASRLADDILRRFNNLEGKLVEGVTDSQLKNLIRQAGTIKTKIMGSQILVNRLQ